MSRAFVFPGQGSQAVGMGSSLAAESAAAREVFAAVDEALGEPLSRLMRDGPAESLTLTANAQPALMAVSIAAVRTLEAETGRPLTALADVVAGHSLGEYSALTAAGTFDVATAARLLRLRGEAMQAAVGPADGAMAAVLGVAVEALESVVAEASTEGVVAIANDNAEGQVVISGSAAAVARAGALAKAAGAKRVVELAVSAPFHCELMRPAAERMAEALAAVQLVDPTVPLVANVSAAPVKTVAAVQAGLVDQVCARVRWRETMAYMAAAGVGEVVEAGAGKVLAAMAKRGVPGARVVSLQSMDDVRDFAAALQG
ncbi:MAG: ACP S-malonyltransferase [Pseudomonadota bacterium]